MVRRECKIVRASVNRARPRRGRADEDLSERDYATESNGKYTRGTKEHGADLQYTSKCHLSSKALLATTGFSALHVRNFPSSSMVGT